MDIIRFAKVIGSKIDLHNIRGHNIRGDKLAPGGNTNYIYYMNIMMILTQTY